MQINEQEYEPTHLDTKNYFHFYEWKEACINMVCLKFRMKKIQNKNVNILFYMSVSCKRGLVRNMDFMIPKIAVSPLH